MNRWPTGRGYQAPEVALTWQEYLAAADVGLRRFASSSRSGHNHATTYDRDFLKRLEEETVGACGEIAFCKWKGIYYDFSVDTYHSIPDVGVFEIRSTVLDSGSLIVRDNDADDRIYVLCTGRPPLMKMRGWILGGDAKKDEWVRNPHGHRPSWFVPQHELNRWNGT